MCPNVPVVNRKKPTNRGTLTVLEPPRKAARKAKPAKRRSARDDAPTGEATGDRGIYQRPGSEYWWIRFTWNGEKIRESSKSTKRRDAEDLLAARRTALRNGTYHPEARKAGLTVGQLRDRWLEAKATRASLGAMASRWKRVVEHFGERTAIAALLPGDVAKFRDKLMATQIDRYEPQDVGPAPRAGRGRSARLKAPGKPEAPKKKKTMSPSAVNKHLVLLRAALRLAAREGYLHHNPADGVAFVDGEAERDRIISTEEYAKLWALADADMRIALALGWWCALRRTEISELTWDRVDLKARLIHREHRHEVGAARDADAQGGGEALGASEHQTSLQPTYAHFRRLWRRSRANHDTHSGARGCGRPTSTW
jgi:integrase